MNATSHGAWWMSIAIVGRSPYAAQTSGELSSYSWKFRTAWTSWTLRFWAQARALAASISESQKTISTPALSASSWMLSDTSLTNGIASPSEM
jgi:hypothetical protein